MRSYIHKLAVVDIGDEDKHVVSKRVRQSVRLRTGWTRDPFGSRARPDAGSMGESPGRPGDTTRARNSTISNFFAEARR